jgi:hypothetical protein
MLEGYEHDINKNCILEQTQYVTKNKFCKLEILMINFFLNMKIVQSVQMNGQEKNYNFHIQICTSYCFYG